MSGEGSLGKASLDLEANLAEFTRNMQEGKRQAGGMENSLDALAAVAKIAEGALGDVRMDARQAAESKASAEGILSGVKGISEESKQAALEIDRVRISQAQASESNAAGDRIERNLRGINRQANETNRALDRVAIKGRSGVGVGPFGSGFGRVGVLGAAVGLGALTVPAAAPGALGLLASIPVFAAGGIGALGALALAFQGVGKAIGGDLQAFKKLESAQQKFVLEIRSMEGWLDKLKQTAGSNLFPGLSEGLHAAFSPGTTRAITTAVTEFARAIGQAGAAWGRYFGSAEFQSIFGPLMESGARNLGVLSDAFLRFFDAIGVVGRAAIPFTNWLNDSIDKGAKLAQAWMHAKDASGGLARGMDEAKTSLRLVGGLFVSLLRVVYEFGRALYPISKIAVKDLTDGLNALAGVLHRNAGAIRTVVGGALTVLVAAVKTAASGIRLFVDALNKVNAIHGIVTIVSGLAAGVRALAGLFDRLPRSVKVVGTALAALMMPGLGFVALVGTIEKNWQRLSDFFRTLAQEIVNALNWTWISIERGAFIAALKVVEPFSHMPWKMGQWARDAKDAMQNQLDQIHAPNMDWSQYASQSGSYTGSAWASGFNNAVGSASSAASAVFPGSELPGVPLLAQALDTISGGAKRGIAADAARKAAAAAASGGGGGVFGTPPPFDKNLGGGGGKKKPAKKHPPLIPLRAQHLEALAAANASRSSALGDIGGSAERYLNLELVDLQGAADLIRAKYQHSVGKIREQLFTALTKVLNEMRAVRAKLKAALLQDRENKLSFAIELAKYAVSGAKEGSAAYKHAVSAEVTALHHEIAFYNRIAKNRKLSLEARRSAIEQVIADRQEIQALVGQTTASSAGANERQFLSTFQQIVGAYAPNAFPKTPASNPKTDTHLYDANHTLRRMEGYLRQLVSKGEFPASHYAGRAALDAAT